MFLLGLIYTYNSWVLPPNKKVGEVAKFELIRNSSYVASHVMHFKGKVRHEEFAEIIDKLYKHIAAHEAEKAETSVVAIHVLHLESGHMDIEVFIPTNKPVPPNDEFGYKNSFVLKKYLMLRHAEEVKILPELIAEMHTIVITMRYKPKPPFYIISRACPIEVLSLIVFNIDIYVKATRKWTPFKKSKKYKRGL